MSCRRRGRHRGRRHDRERVNARVNNDFERERGEDGGDVENMQQAGNALALRRSSNNKIEQENKAETEED